MLLLLHLHRNGECSRADDGHPQSGGQVYDRLNLWLDWWRDLLLVKIGSLDPDSIGVTNVDRLETLSEQAGGLSLGQIRAFIQSIRATTQGLSQNASAKLALEVLMLDIPQASEHSHVKSAV